MIVKFIAHTILKLDIHPGDPSILPRHAGCGILMDVERPLDPGMYSDTNGLLTQDGSKVMTNVLVQGLLTNIHLAHQQGWRDSAEHLRGIISEL